MSDEFDASLVCNEPLSDDVLSRLRQEVESLMARPSALANAKLHAQNELGRLVAACNRLVWGKMPSDLRAPSPEEVASVLNHFEGEQREKLLRDATLAAEQRGLVLEFERAEAAQAEQSRAEQEQLAREEAERREWAEFEAHDAAGKQARFKAWRAARS